LISLDFSRRVLSAGGLMLFGGYLSLLAWRMPIGFDEVWHVFLARQSSPWLVWTTSSQAGHPPLFLSLLALAETLCGPLPVFFSRFFSIICALASLVFFHKICFVAGVTGIPRMIGLLGLAGTPAFFSTAIAVRGYALSQFLSLFGLYFLLQSLRRRADNIRGAVAYGHGLELASLGLVCACATHLSVWVLVFGLAGAIFACETRLVVTSLRPARAMAASALIFALMTLVSCGAMRSGILDQHSYLSPFLYQGDEPVWQFLSRVARIETSVLFPWVDVEAPVVGLMIPLLCLVLVSVSALMPPDSNAVQRTRRVVLLLPAFVLAGLVAASLLGRYPFGGQGRHQLILVTCCWLALAMLAAELRTTTGRGLSAVLAVFIAISGVANLYQARDVRIDPAFWYPAGIREAEDEIKRHPILGSTPLMATSIYALFHGERVISSEPFYGMVGDLRLRKYDNKGAVHNGIDDGSADVRIIASQDVPLNSWSIDLISPDGITAIRNLLDRAPGEEIFWIQERTGHGPGPDAVAEHYRANGIDARPLPSNEGVDLVVFRRSDR